MIRALLTTLLLLGIGTGCTLFATRPVQEMADAASALKAAREVQADIISPDLYRRASEIFFRARREYKFKNFYDARDLANQARKLAEEAELDAQMGGATRQDASSYGDPFLESPATAAPKPSAAKTAPPAPAAPYPYPTPEPTPVDVYEQRRQEEIQREREANAPTGTSTSYGSPGLGAPPVTGTPLPSTNR